MSSCVQVNIQQLISTFAMYGARRCRNDWRGTTYLKQFAEGQHDSNYSLTRTADLGSANGYRGRLASNPGQKGWVPKASEAQLANLLYII